MEDKDLISQLSQLKEIKPRKEWVSLNREHLLNKGDLGLPKEGFWVKIGDMADYMARSFQKPAFVIPALALIVAGGAIGRAAFESLPGDTLYPLRAAVEQAPLRFAGEEERSLREFALTQRRLADLKAIAEQNKVKNLPLAIQEFEANVSKVSEDFLQIVEKQPSLALQASRQIVQLQKDKFAVEQILGTKIGEEHEEEVRKATSQLVEYELTFLESRSLTEEQKVLFEQAKAATDQEDYETALEYIWQLSQDSQTEEGIQEEKIINDNEDTSNEEVLLIED